MNTGTTGRIGRAVVSLAAAAAIFAGIAGGIASSTGEADAALKWREEAVKWTVKAETTQDNNKDGLKHTDTTTTCDPTTTVCDSTTATP